MAPSASADAPSFSSTCILPPELAHCQLSERGWRGPATIPAAATAIRGAGAPDKYAGPVRFDTLPKALQHGPSPVISVEFALTTPDDRAVITRGGVPSADTIWRKSTRQEDGVLPAIGARVIELIPKEPGVPTASSGLSAGFLEVVFRNPNGTQFVLIPT